MSRAMSVKNYDRKSAFNFSIFMGVFDKNIVFVLVRREEGIKKWVWKLKTIIGNCHLFWLDFNSWRRLLRVVKNTFKLGSNVW